MKQDAGEIPATAQCFQSIKGHHLTQSTGKYLTFYTTLQQPPHNSFRDLFGDITGAYNYRIFSFRDSGITLKEN